MAIYGINFNRTEIPAGVKKNRFAEYVRVAPDCSCHLGQTNGLLSRAGVGLCRRDATKPSRFRLVGVGQSESERDAMLVQASNGRRRLHVVARKTAGGTWFGIYTE